MEKDLELEKLKQKLYNKMEVEFDNYKEELLKQNPQVILESCYEKVYKEEILELFDPKADNFNDYKQLKALIEKDKPLDELFNGWMSCDYDITEPFKENVIDTLEDLVIAENEIKKINNKPKER